MSVNYLFKISNCLLKQTLNFKGNHKRLPPTRSELEWIIFKYIICQKGWFHPFGNRTRVPKLGIRANWPPYEVIPDDI